jgi:uncharacterized RDD family membrane protein YckC
MTQSSPGGWMTPERISGPAPGVDFASPGDRLIGYIIDGIIITAVFTVLFVVGFVVLAAGGTYEGSRLTSVSPVAAIVFLVLVILSFVISLLYFPFFWARGGQTLGMRPFGLRVVRDRDGSSIGWGTAFLRLVGLWVAGAVLYIGYIWIFIDKRHRGWQDLIAGTVVIKRP